MVREPTSTATASDPSRNPLPLSVGLLGQELACPSDTSQTRPGAGHVQATYRLGPTDHRSVYGRMERTSEGLIYGRVERTLERLVYGWVERLGGQVGPWSDDKIRLQYLLAAFDHNLACLGL